jgi:hypothetical protein
MLRYCWLALVVASVAAPTLAEVQLGNSEQDMKEAARELPEGRFQAITDKLFPIESTHFGGEIAFPQLSAWERRVSAEHGFDYAFVNAPVFQAGSEGNESYADNEMDLYLQWRLNENSEVASRVFFWGTYVQTFSDKPNGEFSRSQQLLSTTISAGTDPNKDFSAPSALWWEQTFKTSGTTYRAGQLYATSLWGNNRYTADDREGFMNSVLSSNVGLPWSDRPRGVGLMVKKATGLGYVSAGVQDAKANQTSIDASSFLDGRYLYTFELSSTRDYDTASEGRYKLAVGYMDSSDVYDEQGRETQDSGWGIAFSAQREFEGNIALFSQLRHSFNGRVASGVKTSANVGIVFNRPLGWGNDSLGFGLLYARSDDENLRDEFGVEAYWRLQITHRFDLTPDIQLVRRARGDSGISAIPGLRLRLLL